MPRAILPGDDPRILVRTPGQAVPDGRVVVYWMQRAQRADDNPALDAAIAAANDLRLPVVVLFALDPRFPGANLRHSSSCSKGSWNCPTPCRPAARGSF